MAKEFEGKLVAQKNQKFGIVVSRFNNFITDKLLDGAIDALARHGVGDSAVHVVRVPGSFEIPVTLARLAKKGRYSALIALGAVIRGQTPHFEYIAGEVAKGAAQVSTASGVPVVFGVITADTLEDAIERAGTKSGNKGADAAVSAIEMANLFGSLQ